MAQDEHKTEHTIASKLMHELSILALARTAMSSERSLMAWMCASVSLYSFGFSIIKFMDYLEKQSDGMQSSGSMRYLGLGLIAIGVLALAMATGEHIKRIRTIKRLGMPVVSRQSLPVVATVALLAIGVVTFVLMLMNAPR